ncbi:MAG: GTPase Era [Elusimicrobia bacterium]|nr:GTPase Era [Elusimicrobiota bacterium]
MSAKPFRSGFIGLAGLPNAGKSTLLNRIAGGKLAAVSPKPQTTRVTTSAFREKEDYQAVFVDMPGFLEPKYKLQEAMLGMVEKTLRDGTDIICLVAEPALPGEKEKLLADRIKRSGKPVFLAINKTDKLRSDAQADQTAGEYKKLLPLAGVFKISALSGKGVEPLVSAMVALLPEHEAYFPKGQWTDKWERFFAEEHVREQIFLQYEQEIPYSCAVAVETFRENPGGKDYIRVVIYVERDTQKAIIIGKGGAAIKNLGQEARKGLEKFLDRPIHLELFVKVLPGWRNDEQALKRFGYVAEKPKGKQ